MTKRTWVIIGATSIIAEKFAQIAASKGLQLRLIGRDSQQLDILAQDLRLRYKVICEVMGFDSQAEFLTPNDSEFDLFIAHSVCSDNALLEPNSIKELINVNILTTVLMINEYLKIPQKQHRLIFLSSVAAARGRAKNSLYGGSKAAIEVYLEGLQQGASKNQHITIARLGYIDTQQTYGKPNIFYAASPVACAHACWQAVGRGQRKFYFPSFWGIIVAILRRLPGFVYRVRSY
jgi:short-subunit dehydrogenase